MKSQLQQPKLFIFNHKWQEKLQIPTLRSWNQSNQVVIHFLLIVESIYWLFLAAPVYKSVNLCYNWQEKSVWYLSFQIHSGQKLPRPRKLHPQIAADVKNPPPVDRFVNTSPPILWMGALLIHRGVSEPCKQTALEVYLIMSHEETLAAFIGTEGVG